MTDGDAELASDVALLRIHDHRAWDALYRVATPSLLAVARRRLGDVEDARDAVADTMDRAVRSIHRYQPRDDVPAVGWLHGILRNVIADRYRSAGRAARRRVVAEPHHATPDLVALDREDHREVVRAFASLDAADRELLELRVVAGLSAEAVGAILGKRPGAVRMAQTRALERLRSLMEVTR